MHSTGFISSTPIVNGVFSLSFFPDDEMEISSISHVLLQTTTLPERANLEPTVCPDTPPIEASENTEYDLDCFDKPIPPPSSSQELPTSLSPLIQQPSLKASTPLAGDQGNPITIGEPQDKPCEYWVRDDAKGLALHPRDALQLSSGAWLTDKHVHSLSKLLALQFPARNGLQDPLVLAETSMYKSGVEDFVQVVNIARNHWVCVSNTLSPPGVVEVYDSMPSYSIKSSSLQKQVAVIIKAPTRSFELKHVDVQRQVGSSDCALFAMAFATTLCMGGDPHIASYVQGAMRPHLIRCFENRTILPFPAPDRPRRLGRQRVINKQKINVFCICRLLWDKHDLKRGPLVHCYMCNEWFRKLCLGIDQEVIDQRASRYACNACLGL